MAEQYYTVPENPQYNENIRRIQNSDPVNADGIINPIIEALMENTAAVKKQADDAAKRASGAGIGDETAALLGVTGSGDVGELEDLTVKVGRLTNAGAGWNTYRFPEPLKAVPQAVLLQPVDFTGWTEVRNITADGFLYCLRQPVYTAGQQGSVQTNSYYTASGTASNSAHSNQTLVSGVTLPVLPTAENKTTAAAVEVIWLAIEFNGGDQ